MHATKRSKVHAQHPCPQAGAGAGGVQGGCEGVQVYRGVQGAGGVRAGLLLRTTSHAEHHANTAVCRCLALLFVGAAQPHGWTPPPR